MTDPAFTYVCGCIYTYIFAEANKLKFVAFSTTFAFSRVNVSRPPEILVLPLMHYCFMNLTSMHSASLFSLSFT